MSVGAASWHLKEGKRGETFLIVAIYLITEALPVDKTQTYIRFKLSYVRPIFARGRFDDPVFTNTYMFGNLDDVDGLLRSGRLWSWLRRTTGLQ